MIAFNNKVACVILEIECNEALIIAKRCECETKSDRRSDVGATGSKWNRVERLSFASRRA